MLDLICDVVFSALAIAKTAAVLVAVGFEVARRLNIGVILCFLAAEALVDEVDENALTEVAEPDHALEESLNTALRLSQAAGELSKDLPRAVNL